MAASNGIIVVISVMLCRLEEPLWMQILYVTMCKCHSRFSCLFLTVEAHGYGWLWQRQFWYFRFPNTSVPFTVWRNLMLHLMVPGTLILLVRTIGLVGDISTGESNMHNGPSTLMRSIQRKATLVLLPSMCSDLAYFTHAVARTMLTVSSWQACSQHTIKRKDPRRKNASWGVPFVNSIYSASKQSSCSYIIDGRSKDNGINSTTIQI